MKAIISLKTKFRTACQKVHTKSTMLALAGTAALPTSANAAVGDLGTMGQKMGSQGAGLTTGALQVAGFVGVVMVIVGLIKVRSAKDQNEPATKYVTMVAIGALMFAIPVVISIFNTSIIGTAGTGANGVTL